MNILAEAGIDIMSTHKYTRTNALHVAAQREHWDVVKMLAESNYPMDINMKGGLTALIIAAENPDSFEACEALILAGAKIDKVSDHG